MKATASHRRVRLLPAAIAFVGTLIGIVPLAAAWPQQNVPFPPEAALASSGALPSSAYSELRWRLVGPFRGGWATMAAGVPTEPNTFYIGTAGGGVWKTRDAGRTWRSIGKNLPPAIGAIAVAPSDPQTIYAGTGQVTPRYDMSLGRGVFKSTDGGRTWRSVGLRATLTIGRIWIDPHNANVVLVAAMGDPYKPSHARGIYRSTNGGKSWTHVLAINDRTGVVDLASDPSDPRLIYAAAWQSRDWPWLDYFEPHGGPDSGIYRSTDGGKTWTRLTGGGFPGGPLGRIGLAVTHTAHGTRIYAAVDSKTEGGIWRSDDGGTRWLRVNDQESVFGNWYFARLTVDPVNPDVVYSAGQSIRRSSDGGRTWHVFKGAPGGDDYHFVWINPLHPNHLITASDQGAVVSVDGGRSWSSWYNQPTGQFYHVATDDRFPYWIYSGQQDSGSVGAASASNYGALTLRSWHPVGGQERDYMVPDPADPNLVFGSGLGGTVTRWDARTGQVADVSPYPVMSYGASPLTVKYRYGWVTPMVFTPTKPYALLLGAQVLFQSTDLGQTWKVISPDLTGKVADMHGCTAQATGLMARECGFGVISTIAPSPVKSGEIWVGTDSGMVQLTRDDGAHWLDVTPPQIAAWEKVSEISASALDPGTAYVAVDDERQGDFHPYVLRTHDYGAHWTAIDAGLPRGEPVVSICADPVRAGLLYVGTTTGVFVSFDDGAHWQSLKLNLPNARVNDLEVHGNDLIAATQGRAIWVLDDVTPLRQLSSAVLASAAHLFAPEVAWRVHWNNNQDTPLPPGTPQGQNPPDGVPIDYWLGPHTHGPVTLAIYDFEGKRVRRFASDAVPGPIHAFRYFAKGWLKPPKRLSAAPGMHRFVWNLRYARPPAISYQYSMAAVWGENTPTAVDGPFVLPGIYTVVLSADGQKYRAPLVVRLDPREHVSRADLRALLTYSQSACRGIERLDALYDAEHPLHRALEELAARIAAGKAPERFAAEVHRLAARTSGRGANGLLALNAQVSSLEANAESADLAPTIADKRVLRASLASIDAAARQWRRTAAELEQLDRALHGAGLTPIRVPPVRSM